MLTVMGVLLRLYAVTLLQTRAAIRAAFASPVWTSPTRNSSPP